MLDTNIKIKNFKDYMELLLTNEVLLAFCIFSFAVFLSTVEAAKPIDEKTGKLESKDLPEVIKAKVVDITQIKLNPRERFKDNVEPQIGQSLGIYPKERLWNLPNILTPAKVNLKKLTGLVLLKICD